ncbi:MAG: hypothetical protein M0R48_03150 [Candidatus Omnitrophica bacterium]|jgi:hypothetical protein|nr:hypothetical protein [Candidatus Omnitrophota bacterium]
MRNILIFIFVLISTLTFLPISQAQNQETVTIATYYPAPFGVYNELRAQRVAIGEHYVDSTQYCWEGVCPAAGIPNIDLAVEGQTRLGALSENPLAPGPALLVRKPTNSVSGDASTAVAIFRSQDANSTDPNLYGDLTIYGFHDSNENYMDNTMMLYASSGGYADNIEIAASDPNGTIRFNTAGSLEAHERMRITNTGNVGIGTTSPQAKLDVNSTTSGFLPPRMTEAQRNAISSPAQGSVIFNTSSQRINYYDGSRWRLMIGFAGIYHIQRRSDAYEFTSVDGATSLLPYSASWPPNSVHCSTDNRICLQKGDNTTHPGVLQLRLEPYARNYCIVTHNDDDGGKKLYVNHDNGGNACSNMPNGCLMISTESFFSYRPDVDPLGAGSDSLGFLCF